MEDQLTNGVGTLLAILSGLGLWRGGTAVVNRYIPNGQQETVPGMPPGNIPVVSPEVCKSQHEIVETKLGQVQHALDAGGERMGTMTITLQEIKEAQIRNEGSIAAELAKLNGKLRKEVDDQIDNKFEKIEKKSTDEMDRHEKRYHGHG